MAHRLQTCRRAANVADNAVERVVVLLLPLNDLGHEEAAGERKNEIGILRGYECLKSVLGGLGRFAGFPERDVHQANAKYAYQQPERRRASHEAGPIGHLPLGLQIVFVTLVLAGGCYCYGYALFLARRGQGNAALPYLGIGSFSVVSGGVLGFYLIFVMG